MVTAKSSNERPYVNFPNTQPTRNSAYWLPYPNRANDGPPPVVPPKDSHHNPALLRSESSSLPSKTPGRPRYTSFSVYEPQSASTTFPEPQPQRLSTRRSFFGLASPIRHRASKSDIGPGTSTDSLWRPNSGRESYATTVCCFTVSLERP